MDILREVSATQWTFSLNIEPLNSTLLVEVVLHIAREHKKFVIRHKVDQTDRAVWHVVIFLLVLFVAHMHQALNIALQRQLARLLGGLEKPPLDVVDLAE